MQKAMRAGLLRGSILAATLSLAASAAWAHDWNGIVVDSGGNVYVVDADSCRVWKVSPAGEVAVFVDVEKGEAIEHPHHLSIDRKGVLYLASG